MDRAILTPVVVSFLGGLPQGVLSLLVGDSAQVRSAIGELLQSCLWPREECAVKFTADSGLGCTPDSVF